jgi:single-strand DNA-binding protein
MAGSVNKVMLLGRLTRDPESRSFSNGGKVAFFGLAVDGARKKNQESGKWENDPCFLDCKAFNPSTDSGRKLADLVMNYLQKGQQVFIEGHLEMENWVDKDNQRRSKVIVRIDNLTFVGNKNDGNGDGDRSSRSSQSSQRQPAPSRQRQQQEDYVDNDGSQGGGEEDIPF